MYTARDDLSTLHSHSLRGDLFLAVRIQSIAVSDLFLRARELGQPFSRLIDIMAFTEQDSSR